MLQHDLLHIVEIGSNAVAWLATVDDNEDNGSVFALSHGCSWGNSPAFRRILDQALPVYNHPGLEGHGLL
ncbi:hypothetical protein D3C85_1575540 [compost metagenome]